MHVVCPGGTNGRIEKFSLKMIATKTVSKNVHDTLGCEVEWGMRILDRCEGASKGATAPSSSASHCPSTKRTETVGGRTSVTVIVHKEGPPVRHESRVLVSFLPVLFMFPPSPLEGGFLRLYGCRAHHHWASRLDRRRPSVPLFHRLDLVRKVQPVELCLNFRHTQSDQTV